MFATYMNLDVPAEPAPLHAELRSDTPAANLAGSLRSVPLFAGSRATCSE